MKNICTHETSARLKAAGFPQPEPEPGQFWYDGNGDLFCIQATEYNTHGPDYIHGFFIGDDHSGFCEPLSPEDVFAPSAPDILRDLPGYSVGKFNDSEFAFGAEYLCWIVQNNVGDVISRHEKSPAEACAAAWLELKKGNQ